MTLSSALAERVFDGFWLVLALTLTIWLVPGLPKYVIDGGIVMGGVVVILGVLLGVAMFHKHRMHRMLTGRTGWQRHVLVLIEDLYLIGHSRYLYYAAFASIPYLLLQAIPFWAMMRAYSFVDSGTWCCLHAHGDPAALVGGAASPGKRRYFPGITGGHAGFSGVWRRLCKALFRYPLAVITIPLLVVGSVALIITGAKIGELHGGAKSGMPVLKS